MTLNVVEDIYLGTGSNTTTIMILLKNQNARNDNNMLDL